MKPLCQVNKRYRQILIASLISSGSLLPLLPALADPLLSTAPQNSAAPGEIQNQATAEFTDSADDPTAPSQKIVSDIVKVTVAEIAGISATGVGINSAVVGTAPTLYPTSIAYFDFVVKNEGNDPTQLFIPAAPSVATVNGTAVVAGQLQVINYNTIAPGTGTSTVPAVITTVPVTTGNLVNTGSGSSTGSLAGLPNGGSVPAGGYITVRVPITIPFGTPNNAPIVVTLGNTPTAPTVAIPVNNMPYVSSGITTGTNDLYTQDNTAVNTTNTDLTSRESNITAPFNLEREASATQTVNVIVPNISIGGKVWDDSNNSAANTFNNIPVVNAGDAAEAGANAAGLRAILVNSAGNIVDNVPVGTDGTYNFTGIPGFQNGLYVILSTSTLTTGVAPAPTLPTNWTGTSPLTYNDPTTIFNVTSTNVTDKDFGIEQLPDTLPATTGSQPNPPGTTKYTVPTLGGSDPEDITVTKFKIVTLPDPATQGILYYNNVAITPAQVTAGFFVTNPALLKFDPVDGPVSMSFTYASVDKANNVDPTPATVTMPFAAGTVTISGTVINDKDKSATGFTNIKTGAEGGTDTKIGTNGQSIYAILVDDAGNILNSQLILNDGLYSFPGVTANSSVKVILSTTVPGLAGSIAPAAGLPTGWSGTTAQDSGLFNTGLYGTNATLSASALAPKDFGVIQRAKLVIVKRITKINGSDVNPNDNKPLAVSIPDSFNFNATKNPTAPTYTGEWPAGYIVGQTDAGKVKPGDTIEYTIYFMNNQGADAKNVKICDPIRGSQNYVPNSVSLNLTSTSTATGTAIADTSSRINAFSGNAVPPNCNMGAATSTGANNGGVAIDITGNPAATDQPLGIPGAVNPQVSPSTIPAYGMFRFKTQVKP
jgi:uncharacterized repeat protein (TIGR01451 family)